MANSNIASCNKASIHISSVNEELQSILTKIGADTMLLPSFSSELSAIELAFDTMPKRFRSMSQKSNLNSNKDVLAMLHKVISLITPATIFSCY